MFKKVYNVQTGESETIEITDQEEIASLTPIELTIEQKRALMKVTTFQAHAAVARAGLYDAVVSLMASPDTPLETKLAWDKAQTFNRLSPAIIQMGAALGLSETQLDDLFTVAATIEA